MEEQKLFVEFRRDMLLPKGHRTVGNGNLSGREKAKEFGEVREKDLEKARKYEDRLNNKYVHTARPVGTPRVATSCLTL